MHFNWSVRTIRLPVAPVRDGIVFQAQKMSCFGRAKSVAAINEALRRDEKWFFYAKILERRS